MASYTGELATRVHARFARDVEEPVLTEVYNFSKEVALESFKNGLAAGKAKSASRARSAQTTTRSE